MEMAAKLRDEKLVRPHCLYKKNPKALLSIRSVTCVVFFS